MKKFSENILAGVVFLVLLSLFMIGGCDIDFSSNNSGGGSNGGNNTSNTETTQGTIVSIIPLENIGGITVQIKEESSNKIFSDTTNDSGFYSISGQYALTPEMEFINGESTSLGRIFINVIPGSELDLGNIRLENGVVIFENDADITFEGDMIVNNCTDNAGSIEVEAENDEITAEIIVQISPSTDIVRNGDDISCQNILVGQTVEVRGLLLTGNTVDAFRIEVL